MEKNIVLLPGDGIGPEIIEQGKRVLDAVGAKCGVKFNTVEKPIGGAAIDAEGNPLPDHTIEACKKADATLLGAVGGPKWDELPAEDRPEQGLLKIRKSLGLFANLRPTIVYEEMAGLSCLKPEIIGKGLDFLVVRELTGDVYFGKPAGEESRFGLRTAFSTMVYDEEEIRRIARVAFSVAMKRKKKVCSVDKANVLHVSRLWREIVIDEHKNFPEVELSHLYVDNCAMQIILNPGQFDVILTGNLFGDILSDEAAALPGSLGLLPSASLSGIGFNGGVSGNGVVVARNGNNGNKNCTGLYEPVHGSAPDLAGLDKANPLATILSVAMMLRMSLNMGKEAYMIENAVQKVLHKGYRTSDLAQDGDTLVGCTKMGDLVIEHL